MSFQEKLELFNPYRIATIKGQSELRSKIVEGKLTPNEAVEGIEYVNIDDNLIRIARDVRGELLRQIDALESAFEGVGSLELEYYKYRLGHVMYLLNYVDNKPLKANLEISRNMFGEPTSDDVNWVNEYRESSDKFSFEKEGGDEMNASEVVDYYYEIGRDLFEESGMRVIVSEDKVSITFSPEEKVLYIPHGRVMTEKEAVGLFFHEVGRHMAAFYNAEKLSDQVADFKYLQYGLNGYLNVEEGLATTLEQVARGYSLEDIQKGALSNIRAAHIIVTSEFFADPEGMGPNELYERFLELGVAPKSAASFVFRYFRLNGFTKETNYPLGMKMMSERLLECSDSEIDVHWAGKFGMEQYDQVSGLIAQHGLTVPFGWEWVKETMSTHSWRG